MYMLGCTRLEERCGCLSTSSSTTAERHLRVVRNSDLLLAPHFVGTQMQLR